MAKEEEEKVEEEGEITKEQKFLASKRDAFPTQYRSCYILASSPNIGWEYSGEAGKADFHVPLQKTGNKTPRPISTGKQAGYSTEINK